MHFHLPKPLHGWREFAGEVGIIVLGVLIALGAEQVVETLHWKSEAREFRKAVDHELALNLGTFKVNELQHGCVRRRLDELQMMLDRSRNGEAVHLTGRIGGPGELSQYSSVWNNKNADVVAHLPLDVQLKYAQLYDEFRNTEQIKTNQAQVWSDLIPFEEPGPLSLDDRRKLHSLIVRARSVDQVMESNWSFMKKLADAVGLKPQLPLDDAALVQDLPKLAICKPILPNDPGADLSSRSKR
jgi:hypothetical protein